MNTPEIKGILYDLGSALQETSRRPDADPRTLINAARQVLQLAEAELEAEQARKAVAS